MFFLFSEAGRNFMYLPKCLMIYGDDRFIYGDIQKLPSSHNRFTEAVVLFMKIIKKMHTSKYGFTEPGLLRGPLL